jgi:hypothetical protein
MFLKKYSLLSLIILSAYIITANAEEAAVEEKTRAVQITDCKRIEFRLTIDQTDASLEERQAALDIISHFCNTQLKALSEELAEKAPHVAVSLVLLNIEEDDIQNVNNDINTVENN